MNHPCLHLELIDPANACTGGECANVKMGETPSKIKKRYEQQLAKKTWKASNALNIDGWKMNFFSKSSLFTGHASFQGCRLLKKHLQLSVIGCHWFDWKIFQWKKRMLQKKHLWDSWDCYMCITSKESFITHETSQQSYIHTVSQQLSILSYTPFAVLPLYRGFGKTRKFQQLCKLKARNNSF